MKNTRPGTLRPPAAAAAAVVVPVVVSVGVRAFSPIQKQQQCTLVSIVGWSIQTTICS